jgi:4'-phosphopantetheinyl transferase
MNEAPPWSARAAPPALGPDVVHLWRLDLNPDPATARRLAAWLAAEEWERARRFRFAQDQRRFTIRRGLLREVLAGYLGLDPGVLRWVLGAYGKPGLAGQDHPAGLRFSCSHSAGLGLLAVARGRELGVDLECQRPLPDALQMAASCFAPREVAELRQVPEAAQLPAFYDCWTRKEAFVKALGLGLSFPLNRFAVSVAPDQPARLLEVDGDPGAAGQWTLSSVAVGPLFSAALVVQGAGLPVSGLDWSPGAGGADLSIL